MAAQILNVIGFALFAERNNVYVKDNYGIL